ncbi:MAG: YheC/YheD family protein [Alicyclobacillus herbarius]|uniref:YheC/YheD family protein n=1 Tax=Alicyclobacillus herbarius TaxID=122960 RepID=UPI002353F54C|nr:YheC/YheD family protein [Alicyclobacillus herbarius]MCL6633624.1 YheC/YheD family protein [Alicyclobacillus herbarius]
MNKEPEPVGSSERIRPVLHSDLQTLDKWQMHLALTQADLPCHLPETHPAHPESLSGMLQRHRGVYIKPVQSFGGRGISCVRRQRPSKASGKTVYTWLTQGRSSLQTESLAHIVEHFQALYSNVECIVQAEAPVLTLDARLFDIRALMQRTASGEWQYSGCLVRVSGPGAIVSNVAISQGRVLPLSTALAGQKTKKPLRAERVEASVIQTSHAVCKAIAPYRWFHEIGVDYGLDRHGKLWLFEVNTDDARGGPSHDLFAQLPDKTVYERIVQTAQERRLQDVEWLLRGLFEASDDRADPAPKDAAP